MSGPNIGQSFRNDPSGSGASILLNDWTFAVSGLSSLDDRRTPVVGQELRIFDGDGNGGTLRGSSLASTVTTLDGEIATRWTFAGGLTLIDNQTYTAVLVDDSGQFYFDGSSVNPYANGFVTSDGSPFLKSEDFDTVFSANFSSASTPVPFDFEPSAGLAVLGGLWLGRKYLKNRQNKLKE